MLYRKILQNYRHHVKFFQRFSSIQVSDLPNQEKIKKSVVTKQILSQEVYDHLKEINLGYLIDYIPQKLLRKKINVNDSVYIVNRDTAKTFCSLISEDLLNDCCCVIENNPGLGLLTEELLNVGIPVINLYEKNKEFCMDNSPLKNLMHKYESRLKLKELNFADVWMLALRDNFHNEKLSDSFFNDIPMNNWQSKPYAQVILVSPTRRSISLYLYNFFNQTNVFHHGRLTLYIAVQSKVWKKFCADNLDIVNRRYYSQYNVFLNLFFNVKYFGELPRKSFIPWPANKKNAKVDELDFPLTVLKIEPKRKAFEILGKAELNAFWHFLKFGLRTKKNKVISELEKLVPGCGSRIIESDIDICTTFKELSPKELLNLFLNFKSWPEYDENYFMPNASEDNKNEEEEKLEGEENLSHSSTTSDSQASV